MKLKYKALLYAIFDDEFLKQIFDEALTRCIIQNEFDITLYKVREG